MIWGATGAGQPSGLGFAGGYGPIARSAYATPVELRPREWTADFLTNGSTPAYPIGARRDPYSPAGTELRWSTLDWDPALRFWSLPFDRQLTEWLQDVDLSAWATLAAREFAAAHAQWQHHDDNLEKQADKLVVAGFLAQTDLDWFVRTAQPGATIQPRNAAQAWASIQAELDALIIMMQEQRPSYLAECWAQADDIPGYFMHLMAMDAASKPWTWQLMRTGLSIGNVAYMYFKSRFARVRPSTLCPGLVPPFGPPRHPAFPSGHAFLGHFLAASLLQVPGIAGFYGEGMNANGSVPGSAPPANWFKTAAPANPGALMWLAARLATNREIVGLHYPSDSSAGRRLAGATLQWMLSAPGRASVPSFHSVLARARAEWP